MPKTEEDLLSAVLPVGLCWLGFARPYNTISSYLLLVYHLEGAAASPSGDKILEIKSSGRSFVAALTEKESVLANSENLVGVGCLDYLDYG